VNIFLIGLRGSGKTTVGRRLAARMNRPFIDLDEQVLATFDQRSVTEVWSVRGETAWRQAEAAVLGEVLRAASQVVALGGGTPMIDDARRQIEAHRQADAARVVYLRCDIDELARRLGQHAGDRPSLTGADPIDEIETVLQAREPTYRRLADIVYDVTRVTPEAAAADLERQLAPAGN
jgi:shikimate kinase